jgi:transcriptional regulator with XRE-family HTH domain
MAKSGKTFFSRNLRFERELKCLTQEYMASELHMTPAAYARWERGEREPRTEAIAQIADVLEIPVQNLFKRDSSMA